MTELFWRRTPRALCKPFEVLKSFHNFLFNLLFRPLEAKESPQAPNRPLPPPPVESQPPSKPLPPIPSDDQTLVLRRNDKKPKPRAESRDGEQERSGQIPDLLSQHVTHDKSDDVTNLLMQYRQSVGQTPLQHKQRSFLTFGFSAGNGPSPSPRRESHVNVNVSPTIHADTPEIRKYKKRFNSEILCAALWGVNLLIGTENGLMLLDRSGQGKVYQLISRRRFQQMEVLEGQNILITISGKKARVRVYYLSWLKSKIIRTDGVSIASNKCFKYIISFSILLAANREEERLDQCG